MSLQTYNIPKKIDSGQEGCVFRIAKGLVAKICWNDLKTNHEASIAQKLYKSGISVPRPYGIHPIVFPDQKGCDIYSGQTRNGFVMNEIEGRTGFQVRKLHERIEMLGLRDEEIQKARNLGFIDGDARYPGNFIFTPEKKIVLIDFGDWQCTS